MRTKSMIRWKVWTLALCLAPTLAQAHFGVGAMNGLVPGSAHPLTGLDHIAAMVTVGLWAAQ